MMGAPYNPSTLNRIRAGASASELGWNEDRYHSICRKHGLNPVEHCRTDVTIAPPQSAPSIASPEPALPLDSGKLCIFDPVARAITRGPVVAKLTRCEAELFGRLAIIPKDVLICGRDLSVALTVTPSRIGQLAVGMRSKLRIVRITIVGHKGHFGGYRLQDSNTGNPIRIRIVDAKRSGIVP